MRPSSPKTQCRHGPIGRADERRRLVCLIKNLLQNGARIEVHRASIAGGGVGTAADGGGIEKATKMAFYDN